MSGSPRSQPSEISSTTAFVPAQRRRQIAAHLEPSVIERRFQHGHLAAQFHRHARQPRAQPSLHFVTLPQIVERFRRRHEALYTYAMPDQESVLVNARVTISGILEELPREPSLPPAPRAAPRGERRIHLDGWLAAPVYHFDALAPEQRVAGPAIIESAMTTVLLRPGDAAMVTAHGWLDIAIPPV